uniref:Uncharacterized protein n=1 Tax=Arundo donax TaxID=35708 RepID=A0A0A9CP58_ARUDO
MCKKVKIEDQNQMRKTVAEAKERVERSKKKMVSLPTSSTNSNKKKRSGPISALEIAWKMDQRKHLDALIGRAFYSGGMQCKLQNMYISIFKCSTTAVILQYCFLC